jgi:hypothetical protein
MPLIAALTKRNLKEAVDQYASSSYGALCNS